MEKEQELLRILIKGKFEHNEAAELIFKSPIQQPDELMDLLANAVAAHVGITAKYLEVSDEEVAERVKWMIDELVKNNKNQKFHMSEIPPPND